MLLSGHSSRQISASRRSEVMANSMRATIGMRALRSRRLKYSRRLVNSSTVGRRLLF